MEITSHCVVALTWVLSDTLGEELDVLDEPVEFLVGGKDLLPAIEAALQGHEAGATVQLHIVPVVQAQFNIVEAFPQSERGEGGYGSTGKK